MTAQIPEILRHRGMTLTMAAQPLYPYLVKRTKIRRPDFTPTTTACHRGYVGTWEIRDGCLYLAEIDGVMRTEGGFAKATLATAMPWAKDGLPATWVSGKIRCPEGHLQNYVHQAFQSSYQRDRYFDFKNGRLVQEWLVLNPPEPILYRIEADGRRTCVDSLRAWDHDEIADPLGDDGFEDAYKAWGRKPEYPEESDEDYVIGAEFSHPPR